MSATRTGARRGRPAGGCTEDTVATVLDAARRSFAARGYAATSNRQVAAAAGLAHTAIYNHFGSKAQLFVAVFVDVQQRLLDEIDRAVATTDADPPPLGQVLLDTVEALQAADPSDVEFLASMYTEVRRHPELRPLLRGGAGYPVLDRLRALAAGDPTVDADTANELTWGWIAFTLGLAQLGSLVDNETFTAAVASYRRQFVAVTR